MAAGGSVAPAHTDEDGPAAQDAAPAVAVEPADDGLRMSALPVAEPVRPRPPALSPDGTGAAETVNMNSSGFASV